MIGFLNEAYKVIHFNALFLLEETLTTVQKKETLFPSMLVTT
jgi:hypothetical protein